MVQDIFDIDDIGSLARKIIREQGEIRLADLDVPTYNIPADYDVSVFSFNPADTRREFQEIRAAIEPICRQAESMDYPGNLFTAFYEAVLNAYRHGNKRDASKKVTVAHKITTQLVEIAVIDEGGVIDSELISFVLRHREGRHKEGIVDFYRFTGRERPSDHNGTGTTFMHLYVDKVAYFKSETGGLVVHLTKYKNSATVTSPSP